MSQNEWVRVVGGYNLTLYGFRFHLFRFGRRAPWFVCELTEPERDEDLVRIGTGGPVWAQGEALTAIARKVAARLSDAE